MFLVEPSERQERDIKEKGTARASPATQIRKFEEVKTQERRDHRELPEMDFQDVIPQSLFALVLIHLRVFVAL